MPKKKLKTPEYTMRAISKYNEKFTRKSVRISNDIYARLEELYGEEFSVNKYLNTLILADLESKGIEIE